MDLCIYFTWSSLLNFVANIFHQIWKLLIHYFCKYSSCSWLSFWDSHFEYVEIPDGVPQIPVQFSSFFFLFFQTGQCHLTYLQVHRFILPVQICCSIPLRNFSFQLFYFLTQEFVLVLSSNFSLIFSILKIPYFKIWEIILIFFFSPLDMVSFSSLKIF